MEPELAAQLGLQPVDGSPGAAPPDSLAAEPLLEDQRLGREGTAPDPSSPPGQAAPGRVQSLEQENAALRSQIEAHDPNDPIVAAQSYVTSKTAEIDQQALLAYQGYLTNEVAQGTMTQQAAQQEIQMLRAAALAQVQAQALQIAVLPAARQMMAERIAKEFTVGDMKLTAADLLPEAAGGVEAMRARAKALQESRRDQSFATRVQRGTDGAESGGGGTSIDPRVMSSLSPGAIIKMGIMRGHNG